MLRTDDPGTGPAVVDQDIQSRATRVGTALREALARMLQELADAGLREQRALQAALSLSQSATSRLMSGARASDPLETLTRVPGPDGLRKMLRGATGSGVTRPCLERVESAIEELEQLIDGDLGDRYSLDAILSDWVQESRSGFEIRHKAAAYKAMSAIRGVEAETVSVCWVIHPSDTKGVTETIQIDGLYGCRRVRPQGVLHTTDTHLSRVKIDASPMTLGGTPATEVRELILDPFTTVSLDSFETARVGDVTQTLVRDLPLGKGRGLDYVRAVRFRGVHMAARQAGGPAMTGVAGHVEPSCQNMVVDVVLHDDIWPGVTPELHLFDTIIRGIAHPMDPARQADRLDLDESVESLGRGIEALRVAEIPRHSEVIAHACGIAGWDTSRLRGFRCKIRYPVYGSQIAMGFLLPE